MSEETSTSPAEILYAGKFKSVEELEAGYKASLPTFQENEALKRQLQEHTDVPADYLMPAELQHDESRVNELKSRAKDAGLTQKQYEKLLFSDKQRVEANKVTYENSLKEIGDENLNLLKDYVSKNYPQGLQDQMMKTCISDKGAREAAMNHRAQLLNTQSAGVRRVTAGGYTVTDSDVNKAYDAKERNKGDIKARNHYISLLEARAAQG